MIFLFNIEPCFVSCKALLLIEVTMKTTYSESFIEQALVKVYARGGRTIRSVSEDLNVNHFTLKNWMRIRASKPSGLATKEKRPQDWSAYA